MSKRWTEEEDSFLLENYPLLGVRKTSEKLFELFGTKRSFKSVNLHVRQLCIRKGIEIIHVNSEVHKEIKNVWSSEEDRFIIEHSGTFSTKKISEMLFEIFGTARTEEAIITRMNVLRKRNCTDFYTCVPWTKEEDDIVRKIYPKYGYRKTIQTIYEKTGTRRTRQAIHTHAKKLNVSGLGRSKAIGTVVKWNRTYVKIQKDDGTFAWVNYHRYITKAKDDERVLFLNKNRLDVRPENMVCLSASDAAKMIAKRYYSIEPEITKTGILICTLDRLLKDQEKGELDNGRTSD